MGTFIITIAVLGLCVYVFTLLWKSVLKFCYYLLLRSADVVTKVITATKKAGKAAWWLYKRYRNGRTVRVPVEPEEEEVDIDMLPDGLQEELEIHDEVIVKKGDIDPAEF